MKWFYAVIIPIGIVVGVICAALLLMTAANKQFGKLSSEIFIERPPEKVFIYLIDLKKMPLWNTGIEQVVPRNGEVIKIASRYIEVFGKGKKQYTIEGKVVNLLKNQLLQYQLISQSYNLDGIYKLEKIGNNTKLSYSGNITYKNPFSKFISPLLTYSKQKEIEKNLQKLKLLIEKET